MITVSSSSSRARRRSSCRRVATPVSESMEASSARRTVLSGELESPLRVQHERRQTAFEQHPCDAERRGRWQSGLVLAEGDVHRQRVAVGAIGPNSHSTQVRDQAVSAAAARSTTGRNRRPRARSWLGRGRGRGGAWNVARRAPVFDSGRCTGPRGGGRRRGGRRRGGGSSWSASSILRCERFSAVARTAPRLHARSQST